MIRKNGYVGLCLGVAFAAASSNARAALVVSSASPAPGAMNVAATTTVSVNFGQPVMTSTVNALNFDAFGRATGPAGGIFSFSNGNQTVTLTPAHSFAAGETVLVVLSHNLLAADGTPLRSAGYAYSFVIKAGGASMVFNPIDTMSNNGGERTRIYGAMSTDLNHDGYPDLTTVNQISADLRVFLNRADGTGLYHPWLQPALPIGIQSSPNEPGDFDRDGDVDIAVASANEDSVWIALGNGDGTFGSPEEIPVGDQPHGVAVLDADGDGDTDVAVAVRGNSHIALMLNNGSGVFGAATAFDSGGEGEYGLAAADMNNDQITDLVVGARDSEEIIVLRGNGNATFTSIGTQSSGGATWVVATGDLNADGNTDVSTANSGTDTGSILLGNGLGGLSAPTTSSCSGLCVSTDLGDLDGDGDLDWVLSSFGGQVWRVFENNGAGVFSFNQEFDTLTNPSCGIILDFDRDGDLDLALTDETADVVVLMKNAGSPVQVPAVPAMSARGSIALLSLLALAGVWIQTRPLRDRARSSVNPRPRVRLDLPLKGLPRKTVRWSRIGRAELLRCANG